MKKVELNMSEQKKYEVIKAVVVGRKKVLRAEVELGLSKRQINRLIKAYKEVGKEAFQHGNRKRKPVSAMPLETRERIIEIYQSFTTKPNFKHFTEILVDDFDISYSDTTIRTLLYSAGILSPKSQRKTRRKVKEQIKKQKKEEEKQETQIPTADDFLADPTSVHPSLSRKKFMGELVQMDASSYIWFGNTITHLHVAIDDASGDILAAYFDTQETLNGYYNLLHQILSNYGIPFKFKTDRRTVFEYKSKNQKNLQDDTFTQFGFACHQLGIEIEATSVPQAKGRVERLNATLQSRLPTDLERLGITTIEKANTYLKSWIKRYNKKFGNKAKQSVFEEAPKPSEINIILARVTQRKVDNGNHIRFNNNFYLPVKGDQELFFTRKTEVLVIQAFDGNIYLNIAEKIYEARKLEQHELISEEFEQEVPKRKKRSKYIPPQSHPWKLASFKRYLQKIGKSLEEYEAEKTA